MSLRSAIARALIEQRLATETDMYGAKGMMLVEAIASAIIRDSEVNENAEKPGLYTMVLKATDRFGIDGQNTAASVPSPAEILFRLREQGAVITVDQQAVNFGNRPR